MKEFLIKLLVDGRQVPTAVNSAVGQLGRLTKAAAGVVIGGASVAGLVAQSKAVIDYAGRIKDLSYRLGVATESLQEFDFAAKQSGGSLEGVTHVFKELQRSMVEASTGKGEAFEAFRRLGVTLNDIKTKKPEEIFRALAREFAKLPPSAQATSDAINILGRAGDEMLPVFRQGFADALEQAQKLNLVLSNETVNILDEVGDRADLLGAKLKSAFAPILAWAAQRAQDVVDLLDIHVRGAGSFAGTLAGGGSVQDAVEAAKQHANDVIDKRIAQERKFKTERATAAAPGTPEAKAEEKKKEPAAKDSAAAARPDVDQLTRIGLFRGSDPNSMVMQRQLDELRAQTRELRTLVKSVNDDSGI